MKGFIKNTAIGFGLLLALSTCIAIVGNDSDTPTATVSIADAPQQSGKAKEDNVPLGMQASITDDRAVTITGSEEVPAITSSWGTVESKGGKLIVVYATVENTGNESGNLMFTQVDLVDNQGREYGDISDFDESMAVSGYAGDLGLADSSDQLFPGATSNVLYAFRVAPDAEGLKAVARGVDFAIQ